MDSNVSPEERLLRLIRGRTKKDPDKKNLVATPVFQKTKVRLSYLNPLKKLLKSKFKNILDFRYLNIFLVLLLIIFFAYSAFNIVKPVRERLNNISETVTSDKEGQEIKINQPKDYGYYYRQFSKRDIFNAPSIADDANVSTTGVNLKEALKNFRLVGIILDKQPQAVIEDKTTNTTYFLGKGESLNNLKVKEILESKVIIVYGSEEIELEL